MLTASVIGSLEGGDHWDAQGRRFKPRLLLICQGRESRVNLMFVTPTGGSSPLPAKGALAVSMTRDDGPSRWVTLTRGIGLYRMEGGLPLVHEVLNASTVRLHTVTADNQQLNASFDLKGLKASLARYDFYCAKTWLAKTSPAPTPVQRPVATAARPAARVSDADAIRLESLRGAIARVDGVVSSLWMPDRSMMLGMNQPTSAQVQTAVQKACDLMRNYPEVTPQVEVQDLRGSNGRVQRMACPR